MLLSSRDYLGVSEELRRNCKDKKEEETSTLSLQFLLLVSFQFICVPMPSHFLKHLDLKLAKLRP